MLPQARSATYVGACAGMTAKLHDIQDGIHRSAPAMPRPPTTPPEAHALQVSSVALVTRAVAAGIMVALEGATLARSLPRPRVPVLRSSRRA